MNKSELVEMLAAKNGLTYKKSEEIVNIIEPETVDQADRPG